MCAYSSYLSLYLFFNLFQQVIHLLADEHLAALGALTKTFELLLLVLFVDSQRVHFFLFLSIRFLDKNLQQK